MNNLENLPSNLGLLLLVLVVLWVLYKLAVHQCESSPLMDEEPQPFTPDPEHIADVLDSYKLRQPLPVYRKRDSGTSDADIRDLEDLARGTSDHLRGYLP